MQSPFFAHQFFEAPKIKTVVLLMQDPALKAGTCVVRSIQEAHEFGLLASLKLQVLLEVIFPPILYPDVECCVVCAFDPLLNFDANLASAEQRLSEVLDATTASGIVYLAFIDLHEAVEKPVDKFVRRLAEGIRASGVPMYIDDHIIFTTDFVPGQLEGKTIEPVVENCAVLIAECPTMYTGVYVSRNQAEVATHRGLVKDDKLYGYVSKVLKQYPVCFLCVIGQPIGNDDDTRTLEEHLKWIEGMLMASIDGGVDSGNVSIYFIDLHPSIRELGQSMATRLNDNLKGSGIPAYVEHRIVNSRDL